MPPASGDLPPLRGFTDEDIAGFKRLGVEVCLRSEAFGELWLVPEYTGTPGRVELVPEHVATICGALEAFPGSRVVRFERAAPGAVRASSTTPPGAPRRGEAPPDAPHAGATVRAAHEAPRAPVQGTLLTASSEAEGSKS